jgi:hypothetical protein
VSGPVRPDAIETGPDGPRRSPTSRPDQEPRPEPLARNSDRFHRSGPGHPGQPAGGGHRRAQPVHDQVTGMLTQPSRDPRTGRDRGHRLGERLPAAQRFTAVPATLAPHQFHPAPALRQIPRPGAHVLLHPLGEHPTGRAYRRCLVHRRDPDQPSPDPGPLDRRHRQPVQTQQKRRVPDARTGARRIVVQARSPWSVIASEQPRSPSGYGRPTSDTPNPAKLTHRHQPGSALRHQPRSTSLTR